jgi:lipoprotein-releasing system permease protein
MNIISGLVMLVKNKGRDIAILRTMGASQGSVLRVFFMCGALIGASATIAGLVIGSLFCIFIDPIQSVVEAVTHTTVFSPDTYYLSRIPARIEWSEVAIVVAWSLLMSFVATLPPAWRASRLDPVEALRYE